MAGETGKAALRTAAPWLLLGAGLVLLIYLLRKQLGGLDLKGWLWDLLGLNPPSPVQSDTPAQQDFAGDDHASTGVGSGGVTGHFGITDGDTLQLQNNWNLTTTATVPIELVNSTPSKQTVLVQVHVYADYLVNDEQLTWTQLVEVDGLGGKHVEANLNLSLSAPGSRPQLFLDLTVAGRHQARVEHVGTS